MTDDLRPPYRIAFDTARDPYAARNALGIAGTGAGLITSVTAPLAVTGGNLTVDLSGTASSADFPAGAWTAWSPTITAQVGVITSMTINRARYTQLGKTIIANLDVTISNQGTGAGILLFSLPVTASASGGGVVNGREVAATGVALCGHIPPSSTLGSVNKYDGSTIVATGFQISVIVTYEGA